jgi:hypothetical protein
MSVRFDISAALRTATRLGATARELEQIKQRAVGTLRRRLQVEAGRVLGETLNLKRSEIANRITVTSGSDRGGDYVQLVASGRRIPLANFGAQWGGRSTPGATAQVFRDQARRTYKSAFIRGDSKQVATRVDGGRGKVGRAPLRGLFGPSVADMLLYSGPAAAAPQLMKFGREVFATEIERLLDLI